MNAHRHTIALALLASVATTALAETGRAAEARIYQQRTADGGVVLTDRPLEGLRIQRTWQIAREDPQAARQRSEQVRVEAQQVSDRIQRRIDQQQRIADQSELERLRTSLTEARRDADMNRDYAGTGVLIAPGGWQPFSRSGRSGPPRRDFRPGVGPAPRPGAPWPHRRPHNL
jgi:hypothetical protein